MPDQRDNARVYFDGPRGFAQIPRWLEDAASDRAYKLYGILTGYAAMRDGARPSTATLAERLGCARSTACNAISELDEIGALTREPRKDANGRKLPSHYVLHSVPGGMSAQPDMDVRSAGQGMSAQPDRKDTYLERETRPDSDESDASENGKVDPPTINTVADAAAYYEVSEQAAQLTRALSQHVAENGYSLPSSGTKRAERWYLAADRLLRRGEPGEGGHVPELDEALEVLKWAMADHGDGNGWSGWSANIRSMPTFREKFNRLRLGMQAEQKKQQRQQGVRGPGGVVL